MEFLSFLATFVVLRLSLSTTTFAVVDTIRPSEFLRENTTLVSSVGRFELGFFSPGNSKNRYLGIWYKNISAQTVVWVANRCEPINDSSGSLTIDDTGNLVLYGQNKRVVWSTNSSKQARQPLVQLLDDGDLVLRDEKDENTENYLWESFDYPTDTMIPGMKLGWSLRRGLTWSLSAWKSVDDPCDGDLTYGIELVEPHHAYPELIIRNGSAKLYRESLGDGISFSRTYNNNNDEFSYRHIYDEEVYYMYNVIDKSIISRITLGERIEHREWMEEDKYWRSYYSIPSDRCDYYGVCGANSECVKTKDKICQCLEGFKPKNQDNWNKMYWSEGCVKNSSMSCDDDKENDEFLDFSLLKLPDAQYTWVNESMNLNDCKAKCSSNCSCMAYSINCVLWFGDLFDIQQVPSHGQYVFIRIPFSKIATNNGKARTGLKVEAKRAVIIIAIIVGLAGGSILIGIYIRRGAYFYESQDDDLDVPLFDLHTINTATNNFSENNKLGEGGFGPVYKGILEGGQEIAVKRLSICSGQGVNEFKNEIKLIAKLQHRNLVKIFGYCIRRETKLLIYEYMSNKSLDYFIFDERQSKRLDWPKRFQIICGIAKGLLYLHHDSRLRIVHRDLKASNVLLDEYMNPKISDFGLARTFGGDQTDGNTNKIVGTYGYMAPEYASNGMFSTKSDVFSFGTLMLEIISGKKSRGLYNEDSILNLTGLAWTLMKEGNAFKFIDHGLLRDPYDNMEEALRCIHIGLLCVQQNPIDRPNMSSVILMLSDKNMLPQAKPPAYFTNTDLYGGDHSSFANPPSCNLSITTIEAR
ncbi:G-type lectin S-receptor-like serine/threonine-protein kinase At4g27290 [Humulus lupulus]|uniref:G-type lectin S-receptor-like serine/threonine-protein kinase At4g27290 n=1 Tax=Humulus lupulus TaxID=3486 RepID=UPI002B411C95|nr:G-type lectin S-receptor-like serine/threonine-protein kinase At4g27290 [Humulus lupulus]